MSQYHIFIYMEPIIFLYKIDTQENGDFVVSYYPPEVYGHLSLGSVTLSGEQNTTVVINHDIMGMIEFIRVVYKIDNSQLYGYIQVITDNAISLVENMGNDRLGMTIL